MSQEWLKFKGDGGFSPLESIWKNIKKWLDDAQEFKRIEPSKSSWAGRAFVVNKHSEHKRGKPRLVVNYKPLNKVLKPINIAAVRELMALWIKFFKIYFFCFLIVALLVGVHLTLYFLIRCNACTTVSLSLGIGQQE